MGHTLVTEPTTTSRQVGGWANSLKDGHGQTTAQGLYVACEDFEPGLRNQIRVQNQTMSQTRI